MECTQGLHHIDETVGSVCLQWSTDDEMDYTLGDSEQMKKIKRLEVGERFEVEPFSTIKGSVHVVHYIYGIALFSSGLG